MNTSTGVFLPATFAPESGLVRTPHLPLLSIVVPVYEVEQYLAQCLDSILDDTGAEVEVVAVDDNSPDRSGQILDEYAGRDPRVRVIHLATNVGLGRARNAGLDRARGSYVWFVDSDDWLPPGSVAAVTERLATTRPDVLLIDHANVPDGGEVPEPAPDPVLGSIAVPVRLAQRPELLRLRLSTSACTKLVRRELLDEIDLRFPPGWYEDCAYAYPLLLAAGRIDALDRVCYCYRQRNGGAITKSVSPRHFDIFDQYERMWAWVDKAAPEYDALRPELFRRVIDHLLTIAGNEHRLPPGRRREFFGRMVREYRRRRPAGGYEVPGGVAGLKHRLVRGNAYLPYAALRLAWRAFPGRTRARRPEPIGSSRSSAWERGIPQKQS